jgi:aspartate aminotransferase-like enzyme
MSQPLLMIPGPVRIDPAVREAMSKSMISHRSAEFESVYEDCMEGMRAGFGTDGDVVFVNGSGSASMEVAVSNVVEEGDTFLSVENGRYGERFTKIGHRYTDDVRTVSSERGSRVDLAGIESALDADVTAVSVVHAETSTGILSPIQEVANLVADHDALLIVDAITSLGVEELEVDKWGVDIAMTASQKGLGGPPGVSAMSVSEAAKERLKSASAPRYFDLDHHLTFAERSQTPSTSPVQVYWGLQEAIRQMQEEGLGAKIRRHERLAASIREAGRRMGLELYPEPDELSGYTNAVTIFEAPEGFDSAEIVEATLDRGVMIRQGLGPLKDDTFRIGTMGTTGRQEVRRTVGALQGALEDIGFGVEGDGIEAMEASLA